MIPKIMSAMPPTNAIPVVYGLATDARPRMIRKKIAVSMRIWPSETFRPVVQSPASEALMVATSVGPGASAPVRPMRKPKSKVEMISASNASASLDNRIGRDRA